MYNSWKLYFPVEQALVTVHPSEDVDQDTRDKEALRIYMDRTGFNILPQLSKMSRLCGLKDVNSFLWMQGWPQEFAGRDPKDLVLLVTLPNGHPWRLVFNACHYLFKGYQKAIPQMSSRILEKWVDSKDSNKTSWAKTLATLTSTTIRAYSRTFSQLIHLVLVMAERNLEGKTPNTNRRNILRSLQIDNLNWLALYSL
ncbi:hypothetical protein RhiLY_11374 [Ceratobasidium sp. AG-Ba]|nr:hypothetical protein RhiLY_11374 [Ceratobasidium sp. AG-Ba]